MPTQAGPQGSGARARPPCPTAAAPARPRCQGERGEPASRKGGEGGSPRGGGEITQAWFLRHRRSLPAASGPTGRALRFPAAASSRSLARLSAAEQRWQSSSLPGPNGRRRRHLGRHSAGGQALGGGPRRADTHRYLVTSAGQALPPRAPPPAGGGAGTAAPSAHCTTSGSAPAAAPATATAWLRPGSGRGGSTRGVLQPGPKRRARFAGEIECETGDELPE